MAAAAPARPTLSTNHPGADGEESNLSSPLSEVDDKDEELDDPDAMNLDRPAQQEDPSDSDGLSEANDTEAETERLYDTPQVSRQKNLVLGQIDEEDGAETTPSKAPAAIVTGAARDADDSLSDVDMSAPPSSPPGEPLSPTRATHPSADAGSPLSRSKKRKRSPVADRSDSEAPLRKRAGSIGASNPEEAGKLSAPGDGKPEELKYVESSVIASPVERDEGAEGAQREDSPVPEPVVTKKVTRNGSKQAKAAIANGPDNQEGEGAVDNEVEGRKDDEGLEGDAEDDADSAAKHDEEEAEKKRIALEEWTAIEQKFNVFRDRLYKDRLEKLEREEQALTADEPYHTEYLNMKQCLDELYEEKVRKINKEYEYTLAAHDQVAVSRRAMIWGQFYQGVREARLEMLSELNQEWHDTQNTRRHAHSTPDYALLFPSSPAQRVRNAVAYNTEVSILSGMAIHEGFPAAPTMHGVSPSEVEDDLEAIKRARRQRQQSMAHQNPAHSSGFDGAGEQVLRNTPWANSNYPNHTKKAVAGPSSEGQGGTHTKTRVNGQQPISQAGIDRPQNLASAAPADSVRSQATQTKRVRNLPEPSSSTPAKTSQEPSMAKQAAAGASSGS